MRPDVQYNNNKTTGDDNMPYLYVSAEIDGNEYRGRFKSKKKAKIFLARDANYALFSVQSCFELSG